MGYAVERPLKAEYPQHRCAGADGNAGFPKLKSAKGVPIDARLGGNLGDRPAATNSRQPNPLTELFDAIDYRRGGILEYAHYFDL
jgi:hypothetical protein